MGVADYQCSRLLGTRYQRLDRYLERGVGLDDTRDETLTYLSLEATMVNLSKTIQWLNQNW